MDQMEKFFAFLQDQANDEPSQHVWYDDLVEEDQEDSGVGPLGVEQIAVREAGRRAVVLRERLRTANPAAARAIAKAAKQLKLAHRLLGGTSGFEAR